MSVNRRIFVSAPRDIRLDARRIEIKGAIVDEIQQLGYEPQIFLGPTGGVGLAAGAGWTLEEVERVATHCVGAVIIGLPFWKTAQEGREIWLPTDYCQYEGAVAHAYGLPILAIAIGIEQRVIFDEHARLDAVSFPLQADASWLQTDHFRGPFESWKRKLEQRRDVFLGYCSSSIGTVRNLKRYLEKDLDATVLDWQTDFAPGRTILQQIEEAAARCSAGIFLFTKDDKLADATQTNKAVPRDNVVFEAGYFIKAKGKDRVLIVRQAGAKMPADLGGDIYASLDDKSDVGPIKDTVRRFVAEL
jgi:hypothetical protein